MIFSIVILTQIPICWTLPYGMEAIAKTIILNFLCWMFMGSLVTKFMEFINFATVGGCLVLEDLVGIFLIFLRRFSSSNSLERARSDSLRGLSRTKCWGNSDLTVTDKYKFHFVNARIDVNIFHWDVERWFLMSSTEIFKFLLWHQVSYIMFPNKYKAGCKKTQECSPSSDMYLYNTKLSLKTLLQC